MHVGKLVALTAKKIRPVIGRIILNNMFALRKLGKDEDPMGEGMRPADRPAVHWRYLSIF